MPARNPEAVRRRAVEVARRRSGQPATPPLDPVFVALNRGQLPASRGPHAEQGLHLRRAEEIEMLSYRTVVELNAESRLAPQWRVATITRRAQRPQRLASDRTTRADRRQAERAPAPAAAAEPTTIPRRGDVQRCPLAPPPTAIESGAWLLQRLRTLAGLEH